LAGLGPNHAILPDKISAADRMVKGHEKKVMFHLFSDGH